MSKRGDSTEKTNRDWVELQEELEDESERFERRLASARTDAERQALSQEFVAYRRSHQQRLVALRPHAAVANVWMHRNLWATWIEISVEQELEARAAFAGVVNGMGAEIPREFRASLVAVAAAAFCLDALYGELKYLLPVHLDGGAPRSHELSDAFCLAFGLADTDEHRLRTRVRQLFMLRDKAVHPFTLAGPTKRHPSGASTDAESATFNAKTSQSCVDTAFSVLAAAAEPPHPRDRRIERWVERRRANYESLVAELGRRRAAVPLLVPRKGRTSHMRDIHEK